MKKLFVMVALVWSICGYCSGKIVCGTQEKHHVQGIAGDGKAWYWVFTDVIVKTDLQGNVLLRKDIHRRGGEGPPQQQRPGERTCTRGGL